jgi:hypothetical protein
LEHWRKWIPTLWSFCSNSLSDAPLQISGRQIAELADVHRRAVEQVKELALPPVVDEEKPDKTLPI